MRQFLSFFRQFLKPLATSNACIFVSIAWKMNCDILKSKLMLCEWNAFYFIEIAFIGFTLHEIKQCIVFLGHPVVFVDSILRTNSITLRTPRWRNALELFNITICILCTFCIFNCFCGQYIIQDPEHPQLTEILFHHLHRQWEAV